MSENPDRTDPTCRNLAPETGNLRFVEREVDGRQLRILQRYEWSYTDVDHGWYDVPLVKEEQEEETDAG